MSKYIVKIFAGDATKNIVFFGLSSILLLLFKLIGLSYAFKPIYGAGMFSLKNISGFLWQDLFFLGVLSIFMIIAVKIENKLSKIINYILVYCSFALYVFSILIFFWFKQAFDLIQVVNVFVSSGRGQRLYYIILVLVLIVIFLLVVHIISNIITKIIQRDRLGMIKKSLFSTLHLLFISYAFIALGIVGYVVKGNLSFQEGQNIFFNILGQSTTQSIDLHVDTSKLSAIQKTHHEQKLQAFELAKTAPEQIIERIASYSNLRDENEKYYLADLLLTIAELKPDLIINNYQKLKSIKDNNGNYIATKLLEKAINKKSYSPYDSFFENTIGSGKQPNVILVLMESISAVDSKRVSGINDNLPLLDKIQAEGETYTNFLGNANASEESHIATLMGIEIIPSFRSNKSYYSTIKGYTDPLPLFVNNLGYTSSFISSVSIDFLGQRAFLDRAQFHHIIGSESFSGKQKYTFDAAPDADLYDTVLQTVDQQTGPYFIATQTISTHEPYYTPYGVGEKDALKYFDEAIYALYTGLQARNFFDDGILILVSDHRKRGEITNAEIAKYGNNADARILLSIIGTGIQKDAIDNNLYQHTDLFYSLKVLLGNGEVKVVKTYNDLFTKSIKRDRGLKESGLGKKYLVVNTGKNGALLNISDSDISFEDVLDYPNKDAILNYVNSLRAYEEHIFKDTSADTKKDLKIIAHRGYSALYLDNTIEAFYKALRVGVDGIEFDVSYTKDGENIVIHGPTMEQTICGVRTSVKNVTLEQAKKCALLNGEDLLTLDEFLEKTKTWFEVYFLELKIYDTKKSREQTIKAIESVYKAGLQDKVIFTSYDEEARYIISSYKGIKSARDTYDVKDLSLTKNSNHEVFMAPYDKLDTSIVQEAKAQGKIVLTYTVNDTGTAEKVYNLGVDMILTDQVEGLKERWYQKKAAE